MRTTSYIEDAFVSLEERLFAWDADDTTRAALRFITAVVPPARGSRPTRSYVARAPDAPGGYSIHGADTTLVRCNDAALALRGRAA